MKPNWVAVAAALAAARSSPCPAAESAGAPAPVRRVQPVQEYFTPIAESPTSRDRGFTARYTHIGTDYGRMGPGEASLGWHAGRATVDPNAAGWTGVWHSLAGLGKERDATLDLGRCYPQVIRDSFQPRCVGIHLRAEGTGTLTLELKAADESKLWAREVAMTGGSATDVVLPIDPARVARPAKLLNWVAAPGSRVEVDSVGLVIEYPPMSYAERIFLLSYAKLARNYCASTGLVRDQQHRPAGAFDGLPASGMFALATAAAWHMGMVEKPTAERILRDLHRTTAQLPRAAGLLPHFVRRDAGSYRIHPGTEYSTVDTSLFYHGMLLAAQMLGDAQTYAELLTAVKAIRFEHLRDGKGHVRHGLREDGTTPLNCSWADWGGESALVVLLDRLAERPDLPAPTMQRTGKVHGGIGFIGELQSLFYPHFSADAPDALTGVNWLRARRDLLNEQVGYFPRRTPAAPAAVMGLFGLSAGEARHCRGYVVNGTGCPSAEVIHPHYVLMSAQLRRPELSCELLEKMERRGLIPPWGMVENVTPDLAEYAPVLGSLNAAFECLGAYHMAVTATNRPDAVHRAASDTPALTRAVETFYPRSVSTQPRERIDAAAR